MNIAQFIDHTLLKPQATTNDVVKLCTEAKEYSFFSVCINPWFVSLAKKELAGSSVKVCTVIGFPLGANQTSTKVHESREALIQGADELDMVINISALKSKQYEVVESDIAGVCKVAHDQNKLVKVIIETCLLDNDEKRKACELAIKAGADFVKTSTGFSTSGATIEDVALMKSVVGNNHQVKASGGVRDIATAQAMIKAGATRLGTSSGIEILKGLTSAKAY